MAPSIKRALARKLLALMDAPEISANRQIEIGELIKSLLERPRPKATVENVGLDAK